MRALPLHRRHTARTNHNNKVLPSQPCLSISARGTEDGSEQKREEQGFCLSAEIALAKLSKPCIVCALFIAPVALFTKTCSLARNAHTGRRASGGGAVTPEQQRGPPLPPEKDPEFG